MTFLLFYKLFFLLYERLAFYIMHKLRLVYAHYASRHIFCILFLQYILHYASCSCNFIVKFWCVSNYDIMHHDSYMIYVSYSVNILSRWSKIYLVWYYCMSLPLWYLFKIYWIVVYLFNSIIWIPVSTFPLFKVFWIHFLNNCITCLMFSEYISE